ncbi:MAG: acyl-CoA dehydrogenase family protein [Haloplanus sp.]
MPFHLTEEQQSVRRAVREFGENEIEPVAREHDEQHQYPYDIYQEAAKLGLIGPSIPVKYGGAGMDLLSSVVVEEVLWRADTSIGYVLGANSTQIFLLVEYGTETQKETWLPKIATGEGRLALAISEPGTGSDVAGMDSRARRDGDEWILDGAKMWISEGTIADACIVYAKTDPDAGHRGISAFIVPTDSDGYEATPIENKLGLRSGDLAEVQLNGVRVPSDAILGEENEAFYYLMDSFNRGRIHTAAQGVGAAQGAVDAAVEYAGEREQFGQPIGEFQAIEHKLADMATRLEAGRSLTYRAADVVERDASQANRLASMAKLFTSEVAVDVADEAVQVHGGAGFVSDHPVERYYRDARILKIYEGTSEIQRDIIADELR